jgi:hypothetical protein
MDTHVTYFMVFFAALALAPSAVDGFKPSRFDGTFTGFETM